MKEPTLQRHAPPMFRPADLPLRKAVGQRRGALLIVEPDVLAQWSMRMYLQPWFEVCSAASVAEAAAELAARPFAALIVWDEFPDRAAERLIAAATKVNPDVLIVRTATGVNRNGASPRIRLLEKPFQLEELARILGIPPAELPASQD